MESTKKRRRIDKRVLIVVMIVVVIVAATSFVLYSNKNITIEKYSFSETQDINFSFTNSHKENINNVLNTLYIEDDNYFGFSNCSNVSMDLYMANSAVNLAKLIPNYDLKLLKEKLLFLSSANIEHFDFLNLIYYTDLCNNLNINVDYSLLNNKLSKYYDENSNLFYIDSYSDSVHIKIIATSIVKRVLKENLSAELFSPEKGIEQAYYTYSFLTGNDVTLYNSGGDILYCISVFGMNDIIDINGLDNWYKYWKNIYESTAVNSDISALQYSDFFSIARIFQPDCPPTKLQDYYDSLEKENIETSDDLYVLYNILKNINTLNNAFVNNLLKYKISDVLNSDSFVNSNIDVKSTAFGVMLAQNTGYSCNNEKLKNYVKQNYSKKFSLANTYDRTSALYYNLILDQLVNGYDQDYNVSYFQSQIDELLKIIDYNSQSIAADIVSTRRIIEIVSDLQIFDVDIRLITSQKNKIKEGFKTALQNSSIKNSVLLNDIFIVEKILSLDIISDEELIAAYKSITANGGTCSVRESEITPDINSTYQFFCSLNRLNNFEYLQEQKSFVETLLLEEGLYALNINSTTLDLSTIAYGNAISSFEIGGDKDA